MRVFLLIPSFHYPLLYRKKKSLRTSCPLDLSPVQVAELIYILQYAHLVFTAKQSLHNVTKGFTS